MSLKSIVQKRISSWPQQAITVLYCNNVLGDELSQWNKSSMFQDVSYVQVENGSRYAIKQWYAQPTTIASQSVQVILNPHHILVNNRARVCAHGSDGMNISKKAWHEVAENSRKNRTNLSLELVKNATLNDEDIIAIHRIPGRKGYDRPILVKLKNDSAKSVIMKQRSEIKRKSKNAYRLSDDVTKLNSDLINKLAKNDQISSAWYFNGHVYGLVGGVKVIFDIYDDVESKIGDFMFRKNSG